MPQSFGRTWQLVQAGFFLETVDIGWLKWFGDIFLLQRVGGAIAMLGKSRLCSGSACAVRLQAMVHVSRPSIILDGCGCCYCLQSHTDVPASGVAAVSSCFRSLRVGQEGSERKEGRGRLASMIHSSSQDLLSVPILAPLM